MKKRRNFFLIISSIFVILFSLFSVKLLSSEPTSVMAAVEQGAGGGVGLKKIQKSIGRKENATKEKMQEFSKSLTKKDNNLAKYETVKTTSNLAKILSMIVGPEYDSLSEKEAAQINNQLGISQSAMGALNDNIALMMSTPPASAKTYIAGLLQDLHIVPQSYAQGFGFGSLEPVLQVWRASRNIAFLFFVVIFIAIGFMIMFRQQVGQTAVSVQQALPNIIITFVIVALSYAIGGILIDAMFLIMLLMINTFVPNTGSKYMQKSFLQLGTDLIKNATFRSSRETIQRFMDDLIKGDGLARVAGWGSNLLVSVIIALAIFFLLFKIFIILLTSYANIVLSVAFAPIILMFGAIPGKNTFKSWLGNIIGHLSVYPMVLLTVITRKIVEQSVGTGGGFMPPYLLNKGAPQAIVFLVGLSLTVALPTILKTTRKTLGAQEGGFFTSVMSETMDHLKDGARRSPPVFGAGQALIESGAVAAADGLGGGNIPMTFIQEARNRIPDRMRGYQQGAQQIGRFLSGQEDPASLMERAIRRNQRRNQPRNSQDN